ncbi:MAG: response regulator [Bacteroidales bacterium]
MKQEFDWKNKTILIVEDDKFIAFIIEGFLKGTGANLIFASTGEKAIEMALAFSPNLILMDIKLPGINGLETTRIIKKTLPDTIILAQTAYASDADKQLAFDSGCSDFLAKPILREKLLNKIESFLF